MKIKPRLEIFLFLVCSFFFTIDSLYGQDDQPVVAIIMDFKQFKGVTAEKFKENFVHQVWDAKKADYQFYNWDVSSNSLEVAEKKSDELLSPDYIFWVEMNLDYQVDGELITTYAGQNLSGVYWGGDFKLLPTYKLIDGKTGEILDIRQAKENRYSDLPIRVRINRYRELFDGNPDKQKQKNPKAYNEIVDQIKISEFGRAYQDSLAARFKANDWTVNKFLMGNLLTLNDDKMYKMVEYDKDKLAGKGKLKNFTIDASKKDDVQEGELISAVIIDENKNPPYMKSIDMTYVLEVKENSTLCKSSAFMGKKLTNAMRDGKEVFFVRNSRVISNFNRKGEEFTPASVKKDCAFCMTAVEKNMISFPGISPVENSDVIVSFIEKNNGKVPQSKYTLTVGDKKITALEHKTGKEVTEEIDMKKLGWLMKATKNSNDNSAELLARLFLKLTNSEIVMLEVVEQKKNKIKKVKASHPIGFKLNTFVGVFVVDPDNSEEKERLGKALVRKLETEKVAILLIYENRDKLYDAVQAGKKIIFMNE